MNAEEIAAEVRHLLDHHGYDGSEPVTYLVAGPELPGFVSVDALLEACGPGSPFDWPLSARVLYVAHGAERRRVVLVLQAQTEAGP